MKTSLLSGKTILGIATIALYSLTAAPVQAQVIAPGASIAGLSQKELAAKWFQWVAPLPVGPGPNFAANSPNPAVETIGHHSHLGNNFVPGVSFLAGVFSGLSGTDTVVRKMQVPTGNTLFFPIINQFVDNTVPPGDVPTNFTMNGMLTGDFGIDFLASYQNPASLFLIVDGNPLGNAASLVNHTQVNGDDGFIVTYTQPDNIATAFGYDPTFNTNVYPANVQTGAVGYWVGLTLPAGNHTIQFGGDVPMLDPNGQPLGFNSTQNITYQVTVSAPEPGSFALLGFGGLLLGGVLTRRSRNSKG